MTQSSILPEKWFDKRYTPGRKDLPEIFAIFTAHEKESCADALKVMRRIQTDVVPDILKAMTDAKPEAKAWLLRSLGERLDETNSATLLPHFVAAIKGTDARSLRYSVLALARLKTLPQDIELALWDMFSTADLSLKKALLETLRKAGDPKHLAKLDAWTVPAELATLAADVKLALQRKRPRDESHIVYDAFEAVSEAVTLRCYPGLETLLKEQADAKKLNVTAMEPGFITIAKSAPWKTLWSLRLFDTLEITLTSRSTKPEELAKDVFNKLVQPLWRPLTSGAMTYRMEASLGLTAREFRTAFCAELAKLSKDEAINATQSALWQLTMEQVKDQTIIRCSPNRSTDPRFPYRQQAAMAASHPTLAAALVSLATLNNNDVVWDPFAGAGTELLEARQVQSGVRLIATERSEEATDFMAQRFKSLAIPLPEWAGRDAFAYSPKRVTKCITNPPLGRRLRESEPVLLGEQLLRLLAKDMPEGGVLCWMNPSHRHLGPIAEELGLKLERNFHVNMGGITLYMERRVKGPAPTTMVAPKSTAKTIPAKKIFAKK